MRRRQPPQSTLITWTIAPYLIVDDVVATAPFYRDKLGFHFDRFWSDPPAFCMVKRSGIVIMLSQPPGGAPMRPNRLDDAHIQFVKRRMTSENEGAAEGSCDKESQRVRPEAVSPHDLTT